MFSTCSYLCSVTSRWLFFREEKFMVGGIVDWGASNVLRWHDCFTLVVCFRRVYRVSCATQVLMTWDQWLLSNLNPFVCIMDFTCLVGENNLWINTIANVISLWLKLTSPNDAIKSSTRFGGLLSTSVTIGPSTGKGWSKGSRSGRGLMTFLVLVVVCLYTITSLGWCG